MNDTVTNKIDSIQRCVQRAREEYRVDPAGFDTNFTRQDAAVLNVLRACEQSIDLANHIIRQQRLGVPTSSAESFEMLQKRGVIDADLAERLKAMVGFRNAIVHHYQRLDLEIVRNVIVSGLDDLIRFGENVIAFLDSNQ